MKNILAKFNALSRHYRKTLTEGHYDGEAHTASALLEGEAPPSSAEQKAAAASFNLSLMLVGDVALGLVAAATSAVFVSIAALAVGAIGTGLFVHEYFHCKQRARETISETNLAGQTVSGSRADLYRLHQAQKKIIDLSVTFGNAKGSGLKAAVNDDIEKVISATQNERFRVRVLDPGTHHANKMNYDFVHPTLRILKA